VADLTVLPETAPARKLIPPRHYLSHTVAFHYLDAISRLVVETEAHGLHSVSFASGEEGRGLVGLAGEAVYNWMMANGFPDVMREGNYRQLAMALTADATHFLFEALSSAAKGKNSVAFSLLRKPLKENLLYLEWLSVDPDGFFKAFDAEGCELRLAWLQPAQRISIIERALSQTDFDGALDGKFLYELRYGKSVHYGLEPLFEKATHLVTHHAGFRTEAGNLNFVFSDMEAKEEQWDHFYRIVPLLLYYFLQVCERVFAHFVTWDTERMDMARFVRLLAFARYSEEEHSSWGPVHPLDQLLEEFNRDTHFCDCGTTLILDRPEIDRLWSISAIECGGCGEVTEIESRPAFSAKPAGVTVPNPADAGGR
jgi:hypothetical protein